MVKVAYEGRNLVEEISAGIALICEQDGYAIPTKVLKLVDIEQTIVTRQIVCDIALIRGFVIKSSGRGYRIYDVPF